MNIRYENSRDLPNVPLYRLFLAVGWADEAHMTDSRLENFGLPFQNSTFVHSAWHDDQLIGCVRVLSDRIFRSVIYDLAVLPEYQGQGIGRELVKRCLADCPDSEWLLATIPARVGFYEKLGFRSYDEPVMQIPCKWF